MVPSQDLSQRPATGRPGEGVVVLQRIRAGLKVVVGEGGATNRRG